MLPATSFVIEVYRIAKLASYPPFKYPARAPRLFSVRKIKRIRNIII